MLYFINNIFVIFVREEMNELELKASRGFNIFSSLRVYHNIRLNSCPTSVLHNFHFDPKKFFLPKNDQVL